MWGRRCLFSGSDFGLYFLKNSKEAGVLLFFDDVFFFEWSDESLRSTSTWNSVCLTFSPPDLKLFVGKKLALSSNTTEKETFKLPDVLEIGKALDLNPVVS